jgi:hypothetical protein
MYILNHAVSNMRRRTHHLRVHSSDDIARSTGPADYGMGAHSGGGFRYGYVLRDHAQTTIVPAPKDRFFVGLLCIVNTTANDERTLEGLSITCRCE